MSKLNALWVKHASHQKAESLRAPSLSKLDNMVNSNSIFNTKYAEFSTKWWVLLHFYTPTCAYNQRYDSTKNPFLYIFTFLFHPYLFTKSSLQSPLTLPSSKPQQFFTSLFLRTIILTIYTKNIFPTSTI